MTTRSLNQRMLARIFGHQEAKEIEDLIEKEVKLGVDKLSPLAYRLYGLLIEGFIQHDEESSLGVYARSLVESLDMAKDDVGELIRDVKNAVDEINTHTPLKYTVKIGPETAAENMVLEFSKISDEAFEKFKCRIPRDEVERTAEVDKAEAEERRLEEKRRNPRKQGFVPVEYATHKAADSTVVRNISIDGVFIETSESFEIGQEFILNIPFADSRGQVKLQVEVVHTSPLGIGAKFNKIVTPE